MFIYGLDISISSVKLSESNTGWVRLSEDGKKKKVGFNIKVLGKSIAKDLL